MNKKILAVFCLRLFSLILLPASGSAVTLRIVTYNIEADIDGYTTPRPGLDTVIEAIGQQNVNGIVQPVDVVGLEETTSNAQTVVPLVNTLNAYYGAPVYGYSTTLQATEIGGSPASGNGPNSMIYNTQTLVLLESVGVGTPASNSLSRQVARYKFQPVGGADSSVFYVYVSHMKSSYGGTTTTILNRRTKEAQVIRDDSATLPADAAVLYTGDFNMDGSTEPAYQTLTATGPAQGIDPLNYNPQDNTLSWETAASTPIATESAVALQYRDDIQFMTSSIFYGTVDGGIKYVPGSYRVFGNNGTTAFEQSVNATTNTSLANLQGPITAAQALYALTTASDHLPVVADYSTESLPPVPTITSANQASTYVGQAFTYQITATNDPTSFNTTGLPSGLTMDSATGIISGTATQSQTNPYNVVLTATNANGSSTGFLSLSVLRPPTPVVTGPFASTGRQFEDYYYKISATNNPASYMAGGYPAGLSFNTATGELTGKPTVYGNFLVAIYAYSSAGDSGNAYLRLTVTQAVPVITSTLNPTSRQGVSFLYQITGTNTPTQFTASGLPAGLTLGTSTGKIMGAPSGYGTFTVPITASNSGGMATANLNLVVKQAQPVITSALSGAPSREGVSFLYQITATNSPTKYGATGLPAGLIISQSTGKITGHPSRAGTYTITIAAFNSGGSGSANLMLVVKPPL